jgi:hypothetical protein
MTVQLIPKGEYLSIMYQKKDGQKRNLLIKKFPDGSLSIYSAVTTEDLDVITKVVKEEV